MVDYNITLQTMKNIAKAILTGSNHRIFALQLGCATVYTHGTTSIGNFYIISKNHIQYFNRGGLNPKKGNISVNYYKKFSGCPDRIIVNTGTVDVDNTDLNTEFHTGTYENNTTTTPSSVIVNWVIPNYVPSHWMDEIFTQITLGKTSFQNYWKDLPTNAVYMEQLYKSRKIYVPKNLI